FKSAAGRAFGLEGEQVVGKACADVLIPRARRASMRRTLRDAVQAEGEARGVEKIFEIPAQRRDGSELRIELALKPQANASRKRITAFVRDLSKQSDATTRLAETEARIRSIVETAADAILALDDHGRIASINPAGDR